MNELVRSVDSLLRSYIVIFPNPFYLNKNRETTRREESNETLLTQTHTHCQLKTPYNEVTMEVHGELVCVVQTDMQVKWKETQTTVCCLSCLYWYSGSSEINSSTQSR